MHTHTNRPNSCLLVRFSFLWYIVCYGLPLLDLAFTARSGLRNVLFLALSVTSLFVLLRMKYLGNR